MIQLNSTTITNGLKFDFHEFSKDHWLSMSCLSILSFHNLAGTIMNNTMIPLDPSILNLIGNGSINASCPADTKYSPLQITWTFESSALLLPFWTMLFFAQSIFSIPQSVHVISEIAGNPKNLTTFLGIEDLQILTMLRSYLLSYKMALLRSMRWHVMSLGL